MSGFTISTNKAPTYAEINLVRCCFWN